MTNHATTPAIKHAAMTPPTTPPAIAAVFEVPEDDVDDVDEDVSVKVVWLPLVAVGIMVALPVTSGLSVTKARIHKRLMGHVG
jgi:hypothetical protein